MTHRNGPKQNNAGKEWTGTHEMELRRLARGIPQLGSSLMRWEEQRKL